MSDTDEHRGADDAGAPTDERTEYPAPHRSAWLAPVLAVVLVASFLLGGTRAIEALGDAGLPSDVALWGGALLAVFAPFAFAHVLKRRSERSLVLDAEGIELAVAGGRRMRMGWEEVASLRWGGFLSRGLIVSDDRGARRIRISTRTDDFDEIADRVVARTVDAHRDDPSRLSPPSRFRRSPWGWIPVWILVLGTGVPLALTVPYGWIVPAVLALTVLVGQLATMGRVAVKNGWLLERGGLRWRRTPLGRVEEVRLSPPRSHRRGGRGYVDLPAVELLTPTGTRKVAHASSDVLALWAAVEVGRRRAADRPASPEPAAPRGALVAGLLACAAAVALFSVFGIRSGAFLQTAVFFGTEPGVRLALAMGSDPDTEGLFYDPPLYTAVGDGSTETARLLLERGADPSVREPDAGFTPLHRAARDGNAELVELLLDAGADLHATTWRNSTPLSQAVFGGHEGLVRLLHRRGAELDHPGPSDQTPLNYALRSEAWSMADLLVELGARPDVPDVDGFTPFQLAASRGHEPTVRAFLDSGVDPDLRGPGTAAPVALAAARGHAGIVALLLDRGADPGATVEGSSLTEAAREGGHDAVLEVLGERGSS